VLSHCCLLVPNCAYLAAWGSCLNALVLALRAAVAAAFAAVAAAAAAAACNKRRDASGIACSIASCGFSGSCCGRVPCVCVGGCMWVGVWGGGLCQIMHKQRVVFAHLVSLNGRLRLLRQVSRHGRAKHLCSV
jgi:hypothetical protein